MTRTRSENLLCKCFLEHSLNAACHAPLKIGTTTTTRVIVGLSGFAINATVTNGVGLRIKGTDLDLRFRSPKRTDPYPALVDVIDLPPPSVVVPSCVLRG